MGEINDSIYRTANLVPTNCGTRGKEGRRTRNMKTVNTTRKKERKKKERNTLGNYCISGVFASLLRLHIQPLN